MGRWLFLLILLPIAGQAQVSLRGSVRDALGQPLPLAHIQLPLQKRTLTASEGGEFSASLPAGRIKLVVSFTGYQKQTEEWVLTRDTVLWIVLESRTEQLGEVVVQGNPVLQSDQFDNTRGSTLTLTGQEVNAIPVLGGEADVIKTLQLLPGSAKGVEGSTDLFVRGGAADQNLVLLDGAPVYTTGHLFGFLSVFNPDILEGVSSVNGAFPAYYGGRLSSIIDVTTQSRALQRTQVNGNIGLLASRLMVRQPLVKNKLDLWVAGRRTYIDQVVRAAGESLPYFFYDLNGKISYRPSSRDYLEFTYYSGKDVLAFEREPRDSARNRNITSDFTIANQTQTMLWRRSLARHVYSRLSLYHTRFNYTIQNTFEDNRLFVNSSIRDWGGQWRLQWDSLRGISLVTGVEVANRQVSPNIIDTSGELAEVLQSSRTQPQQLVETSVFTQADGKWNSRWAWSAGLRFSSGYVQEKLFVKPEPRLAVRYQWTEQMVWKLSYSRMTQYLHRVSSAAVAFPTDIWYPVTPGVRPQTSDQVTLAWQRVEPRHGLFISAEVYYKDMRQLIGYREGTNLFLNTEFEQQLIQGAGRAYGLELLVKKETGKLTGWIGYTLSRSERQFDEIGNGRWFLSRYDRRHNGSVVANYALTPRWSLSAVFEIISGSRFTPIIGQYVVPSPTLVGVDLIPVYAPLNSVKLADTHRLDLGVKWRSKPTRKIRSEWFVGVYNVYNRATPIGITIEQDENTGALRYEQPGLFGLLPFVSYGFKL